MFLSSKFLKFLLNGFGPPNFQDRHCRQRMENVILGALKWLMPSVTPFSFFSFFLGCLFDLKEDPLLLKHSLKSQATDLTFISSMVNSNGQTQSPTNAITLLLQNQLMLVPFSINLLCFKISHYSLHWKTGEW